MNDAIAALVIGYLLGSLPFGYWAGRLKGVDLRKVGSGNTGGTNAIRILGARYGVPVILLDMAQGRGGGADRAVSSRDVDGRGAGGDRRGARPCLPGLPAFPRRQGRCRRRRRDVRPHAR